MMIRPIEWIDGNLRFLDQTALPGEERYVVTDDASRIVAAISRLEIRGAPLIGIAAAYAVVLATQNFSRPSTQAEIDSLLKFLDHLSEARPTAVNLSWAVDRMRMRLQANARDSRLQELLLREAQAIHEEDQRMCDQIAAHGLPLLPEGGGVLTHCNTGALATGGGGTALNIIRLGWERGIVSHVYVDETRPLLQGARLTAWELQKLSIPYTLIPDSAAALLMRQKRVQCVVVGADRIARNGDVANKIGSYGLAIHCRHHGIPFFVAAPSSSIDPALESGNAIPIEVRDPQEVTRCGSVPIAPESARAYSPAFDVTSADLVAAIITEAGVFRHPYEFTHVPGSRKGGNV